MNLLDRFKQSVIGSRGTIADYTSIISVSGDFTRISDLETLLNSWSNILLTPLRTYDNDPTYGSLLYKMVFQPADEKTRQKILNEVKNRLVKFDDRGNIKNIDVYFLSDNKGFVIDIVANYRSTEGSVSIQVDDSIYSNYLDNFP
jgi:phage baseplate assembly protein W